MTSFILIVILAVVLMAQMFAVAKLQRRDLGRREATAAVHVLRHVFSSLPFADACKCTRTLRLDGDMQVVVVDRESGRAANGNPSKSATRILGEVREPTHQTQISVGRAVTDDGAFSVVTAALSPRAYCVIFGEESE